MARFEDLATCTVFEDFHRLVLGSGKPSPKAVVAIAREFAGFVWTALYLYPQLRAAQRLAT